jgi:hypothetical protein
MNAWILEPALSGSASVAVPAVAAGLDFAVRTAIAFAAPDALRQKSNRTSTGAIFTLGRMSPSNSGSIRGEALLKPGGSSIAWHTKAWRHGNGAVLAMPRPHG